jgi:hypothetical protein
MFGCATEGHEQIADRADGWDAMGGATAVLSAELTAACVSATDATMGSGEQAA